MATRERFRARRAVATALSLFIGLGCAGAAGPAGHYDYFAKPNPADPWSPKIANWQLRERATRAAPVFETPGPVAGSDSGSVPGDRADAGDLRAQFGAFERERKREVARDFARWVQEQSRAHYQPDGPIDHWATLEETFRANGDDCDGLELLAYHFLRDMGFGDDEVYRAIVYRPSDGQHHMVTLWFETPTDPWVIDPTGAMTTGMPRMSERPDWVPLKVFSETSEFSVQDGGSPLAARMQASR